MKRAMLSAAVAASLLLAAGVQGADYPDVDALLKRMAEKPAAKAAGNPAEPAAAYGEKIKAFKEQSAKLAPAEAAAQWLALLDSAPASREGRFGDMVVPARDAMLAMPGPAAWEALAKAIDARPVSQPPTTKELGLRLLARRLSNDEAGVKAAMAEIRKAVPRAVLQQLRMQQNSSSYMHMADATPEERLAAFEEVVEAGVAEAEQGQLEIPDLVTIVGREKAEALIAKALSNVSVKLSVENDGPTAKLAQSVALKNVATMKVPQWGLIGEGRDAVALYEAMEKKFPIAKKPFLKRLGIGDDDDDPGMSRQNYERQRARSSYLTALVQSGEIDKAIALVNANKSAEAWQGAQFRKYGMQATPQAYEFLSKVMKANPGMPWWDELVSVASDLDKTDEALAMVRAALAGKELAADQRTTLEAVLRAALLADDRIDEGLVMLRAAMAAAAPPEDGRFRRGGDPMSAAVRVAWIGHALQRPELVTEGLARAKQLATEGEQADSIGEYVELLVELNRGPEAAEVLQQLIAKAVQPKVVAPEEFARHRWSGRDGSDDAPELLAHLMYVYHKAGRHAHVIALLDRVPNWGGATDLAVLRHAGRHEYPLSYMAAAAFAATGKKDDALRVVNVLLETQHGFDPAYQLLTELLPPDQAIARLDALLKVDQFEERPLIWKADLLRKAGKLDEAEAVVRQAIAIDPSDGEQPRGDRMRAYAVLADVLRDRGDVKNAQFFRDVLKAIRTAEDADRLNRAGLTKRALKMYADALQFFADAYCIQSRLAVQFAAGGEMDKAEAHYKKAYELMPSSFGRVESHCFGCEGAFSGERQQSIAEGVFLKMAAAEPNKPQVHYLLGYLRTQQGRHAEALGSFNTAVRLDPDYLNAWNHVMSLAGRTAVPPAALEDAAINLVRLDPRQRHSHADLRHVRDLRMLWKTIEEAGKVQFKEPTELYPLAAAAKAPRNEESSPSFNDHSWSRLLPASPAEAVMMNKDVAMATMLIMSK